MKPLIDNTTLPPGYIQKIKYNKNKIYLGSNIKKLRKAYGLTQLQLSKEIHKQRGMVSLYEKENVYPDLMTLIDLSNYLKVNLISLIFENISIEIVIKIRQNEHR